MIRLDFRSFLILISLDVENPSSVVWSEIHISMFDIDAQHFMVIILSSILSFRESSRSGKRDESEIDSCKSFQEIEIAAHF